MKIKKRWMYIVFVVELEDATYKVKAPTRMQAKLVNGVWIKCKIFGIELNLADSWRNPPPVNFMGMKLWLGEIKGEPSATYAMKRLP